MFAVNLHVLDMHIPCAFGYVNQILFDTTINYQNNSREISWWPA